MVGSMPERAGRSPRPKALIFDLDGTLVDTVQARIDAWRQALGEAGFPVSREQLAPLIGVDGKRLARQVAAAAGKPIDGHMAQGIGRNSGGEIERLDPD